jgi:acid phosphatase type 7
VIAGDVRGPYLTGLGPAWAQIAFHTEIATDAILHLREKNGIRQVPPVPQGQERHLFELKDLTPGTRYGYCVEYGNPRAGRAPLRTEAFFFTTPSMGSQDFRFIAYGDSRDRHQTPKRHREVAANFLRHQPEFIVSTGDVLVGGVTASSSMFGNDWTKNFFEPLKGIIESVPYYPAVGNHDQDLKDGAAGMKMAFPQLGPSLYYSFDYHRVHFTVLHCANRIVEFERQKQWFIKDMERAKDADWRIVILHVSPFTTGKYAENEWTVGGRKEMLETFVKQGVDLVLSGHDHSYQRFYPLKADAGDNHTVLFIVTGLAGTNPYFAKGNPYSARVVNNIDHFCVIRIALKTLEITAYGNDNRVLDHVVLSKEGKEKFVRSALVWEERIADR